MTERTSRAFPWFELTILVALVLIGWVAWGLYKLAPEVDESRSRLSHIRSEYYQLSQFVQEGINEQNDALTNFLQSKDPLDLERFQRKSREWQQWIDDEKRKWTQELTAEDRREKSTNATNQSPQLPSQFLKLLSQIEANYGNYQRAALYLMKNNGQPLVQERVNIRTQNANRCKARLLTLARQARMRAEAVDLILASMRQSYGVRNNFQDMLFALLLALVGLSFMLMLGIYRKKMAQTKTIIQQQTRQQIEQEARLDKLAHFSRLAQELAHEIKQPLTAINARIYTLQKLLPPNAETHKDAVVIRNEIKRLDRTLKDFLELARPAEPKLVPVAAEQTLNEICDLMGSQLEQESIELKCDSDTDVDLMADPQQLKQVLINLVKNAAESLDGSGKITLRARKSSTFLNGESTEVATIEVADTGPGIPLEIRDRIFDPFFSTKGDGTGLGLAIAARIVDKHGGSLDFDTEPGKGTTFRIKLPAAAKENLHEQSPVNRG